MRWMCGVIGGVFCECLLEFGSVSGQRSIDRHASRGRNPSCHYGDFLKVG